MQISAPAELDGTQPLLRPEARRAVVTLAALLFVAPFTWPMYRPPLPSFDTEWLAAIVLAALAVAIGAVRPSGVHINWPVPAWFGAFLAIAAIQYARGVYPYADQLYYAAVYAFAIVGAYWVGRALVAAGLLQSAIRGIGMALIVGGLFTVFVQTLQLHDVRGLPWWLYFDIADEHTRTRPFGNLAQANHAAAYLSWALLATLFFARGQRVSALVWLAACALAYGIALTRSRMGLGFAIVVLLGVWLPTGLRPEARGERWRFTTAVIAGYVLGVFAIRLLSAGAAGQVADALERFAEGSLAYRTAMWQTAWQVASTAPWLGVGFLDYGAAQYWVAEASPYIQTTTKVHNIVLQLAAEMGWPLALALCALALWWAAAGWRARLASSHTAFIYYALAVIAIHSQLEWPLWILSWAAPTALLFALGEPRLQCRPCVASSRLVAVAGLAGVILAVPARIEYEDLATVELRFVMARAGVAPIDSETVLRVLSLAEASRFKPFAERLYAEILSTQPIEPTPEHIALHERLLWQGADPVAIGPLVILNAKAGHIEEAMRHAERMAVFWPELFPEWRTQVLDAIRTLGPEAAPLREQLANTHLVPKVQIPTFRQ